ncbi:MAG TPA: MAPEG family protein, partial [Lysobacter sp.]|nr:MAPEG family protein [Lysobacter sp.]
RDAEGAPVGAVTDRVNRALHNFLETFPFFAAAVLAAAAAGRLDATTALGAQLYFWARVAYIPLYAAGVPYIRTVVWGVSIVGLVMVLAALF